MDKQTQEQGNDVLSNDKKYKKTSLAIYSGFLCVSHFLLMMILAPLRYTFLGELTFQGFCACFAMTVLISYFLLLFVIVGYALYRAKILGFLFMLVPFAVLMLFVGYFTGLFDSFWNVIFGLWMSTLVCILLCLFGIATIVSTIAYLCYFESDEPTRPSESKRTTNDNKVQKERKVKNKKTVQEVPVPPKKKHILFAKKKGILGGKYIIKDGNKKKLYKIKPERHSFLAPTLKLFDMNKSMLAFIFKESSLLSSTNEYKAFVNNDPFTTITQKKRDKSYLSVPAFGWHIEGDFIRKNYNVLDENAEPVIKVRESANSKKLYEIEYLIGEDEILGLVMFMAANLAYRRK